MRLSLIHKKIWGLLLLSICNTCFSQTVTRNYIDSALKTIDTTYRQKRGVLYVINGVPFDSLQIDKRII